MKNGVEVFLSLGSNMGDRLEYLQDAEDFIEKRLGSVKNKSSIYESEAWGNTNQDIFLNQILRVQASFSARKTLEIIQKIENDLERKRIKHWGPRTIDIDILFYNNQIISDKDLIVPHPEIENRRFILTPMEELSPDLMHPVTKQTIKELLSACKDTSNVIVFKS